MVAGDIRREGLDECAEKQRQKKRMKTKGIDVDKRRHQRDESDVEDKRREYQISDS